MNTTYLRGQLYYADLSKGVGSEQEGYRPDYPERCGQQIQPYCDRGCCYQ